MKCASKIKLRDDTFVCERTADNHNMHAATLEVKLQPTAGRKSERLIYGTLQWVENDYSN